MYQNITISIPKEVFTLMKKTVGKGVRSQFISEAIRQKLTETILKEKYDLVEETRNIQKLFGGTTNPIEVKKLINKGRL